MTLTPSNCDYPLWLWRLRHTLDLSDNDQDSNNFLSDYLSASSVSMSQSVQSHSHNAWVCFLPVTVSLSFLLIKHQRVVPWSKSSDHVWLKGSHDKTKASECLQISLYWANPAWHENSYLWCSIRGTNWDTGSVSTVMSADSISWSLQDAKLTKPHCLPYSYKSPAGGS